MLFFIFFKRMEQEDGLYHGCSYGKKIGVEQGNLQISRGMKNLFVKQMNLLGDKLKKNISKKESMIYRN